MALRLVMVLFLLAALATPASAQGCWVVATRPGQGVTDASSISKEIMVRFNAPVKTDRYSFVKHPLKGAFPRVTGKPYFISNKECRLPVALKPDTTYAIGVNTGRFTNFRLAADERLPCLPFLLIFHTGPAVASSPGRR